MGRTKGGGGPRESKKSRPLQRKREGGKPPKKKAASPSNRSRKNGGEKGTKKFFHYHEEDRAGQDKKPRKEDVETPVPMERKSKEKDTLTKGKNPIPIGRKKKESVKEGGEKTISQARLKKKGGRPREKKQTSLTSQKKIVEKPWKKGGEKVGGTAKKEKEGGSQEREGFYTRKLERQIESSDSKNNGGGNSFCRKGKAKSANGPGPQKKKPLALPWETSF